MNNTQNNPVAAGRQEIARLAQNDGETQFAREVLAGCWDHRSDVARAIENAGNKDILPA